MSENRTTRAMPISDTMQEGRYTRRNRLKIPGKRGGRHLSETPVGKQVIAEFTEPLVERLTGLHLDPPGGLADALAALPPEDLGQAILTPFMHGVFPLGPIRESLRRDPAPPGRN